MPSWIISKQISSIFILVFLLYSHEQLYIHIYMQKHNDIIKTSGHSSLEKYTSHFIERIVCEGGGQYVSGSRWASNYYITPATGSSDELERRCWNENHVSAEAEPPGPQLSSPGELERKAVIARRVGGGQYVAVFVQDCSTGGLGAQPLLRHGSHSSIFSPTYLNFLSPGLYNNLTPTYFLKASQFALSSTPRQSRSPPDIFDHIHLLFTQVHFFFWQLGRGQYVTFLWAFTAHDQMQITIVAPPGTYWMVLWRCHYPPLLDWHTPEV